MVAFTKETPRHELIIEKEKFKVPAPYIEGHTCTKNEAGVLNQILRENVRNNTSSKLKKLKEDGEFDTGKFQKDLDHYTSTYEFGMRRGGVGRAMDPVDREMKSMAKELVKRRLVEKGHKLADVSTEEINKLVASAIDKYGDKMREKAEAIVVARAEATELLGN